MSSGSDRAVLAGTLGSLAAGLAIPRGFASWMARKAWRRLAQPTRSPDGASPAHHAEIADGPLRSLVLASLTLSVGFLMLVLPSHVRVAAWIYECAQSRFVWSDIPLQMLEAAIAFLASVLPLGLLGMAVSCAHHSLGRAGAWDPQATGLLCVGCAGGSLILCATSGQSPQPLILTGALCAFMVSLLCGLVAGAPPTPPPMLTSDRLPMWSDRRPRRLRFGVQIVGLSCVCAFMLGITHARMNAPLDAAVASVAALLVAASFLTGCVVQPRIGASLAGFGGATIFAGILTAIGAWLACSMLSTGVGVQVALILSTTGAAFATGYGWTTLQNRVPAASSEGNRTATRLLIGSAVCAIAVVPILASRAGEAASLLLLSLAQAVTGGVLVVRQPWILCRERATPPVVPNANV